MLTGLVVEIYSDKYKCYVIKTAYHLDVWIEDDEKALKEIFNHFPIAEMEWKNPKAKCKIVRWK